MANKKCKWCGKEFIDNTKNKNKKYCCVNCRRQAYLERQQKKSKYNWEDDSFKEMMNKQEDYYLRFKDLDFHQNDNKWGLGESNLLEHRHNETDKEIKAIKSELRRIFKRKPNI